MEINRENYDRYVIDFIEGNLKGLTLKRFHKFLSENVDIEDEIQLYINSNFNFADNIELESKDDLKFRNLHLDNRINTANYEEFIVADIHGDLSPGQKLHKNIFLAANNLQKEEQLFKKIKLCPDKTETFGKASILKKRVYFLEPTIIRLFAAASIIIAAGFLFYLFQNGPGNSSEKNPVSIANIDPIVIKAAPSATSIDISLIKTVPTKVGQYAVSKALQHDLPIGGETTIHEIELKKLPIIAASFSGPTGRYDSQLQIRETNKRPVKPSSEDYYSLKELAEMAIKEKVAKSKFDFNQDGKIELWEIVDGTSQRINSISEGRKIIDTKFNDQGKLMAFNLDIAILKITRERN